MPSLFILFEHYGFDLSVSACIHRPTYIDFLICMCMGLDCSLLGIESQYRGLGLGLVNIVT